MRDKAGSGLGGEERKNRREDRAIIGMRIGIMSAVEGH